MTRIFVAIATVGRAELVRRTVDLLADQIRPADGIVVVGSAESDVAGVGEVRGEPEVTISERGFCRQRNAALDHIGDRADVVVFFDDDFIPAPLYLAEAERLFDEMQEVVGITGDLIADGIHTHGYSVEEGLALIARGAAETRMAIESRRALYGCNMAVRLAAIQDMRFDEALPLYGWQEDIDFTCRLGHRGRLISTGRVTGVHLGTKGGRTSGKRLGYSQVANLVYLWRKGTMQPGLGEKLLRQNLVSNLYRSIVPKPHIDHRGRLLGNLIALKDWATGRIDPRRIETM